jgi:hypothetical protein
MAPALGELTVDCGALGHPKLGLTKHPVKLGADEVDFVVIPATPDTVQQKINQ